MVFDIMAHPLLDQNLLFIFYHLVRRLILHADIIKVLALLNVGLLTLKLVVVMVRNDRFSCTALITLEERIVLNVVRPTFRQANIMQRRASRVCILHFLFYLGLLGHVIFPLLFLKILSMFSCTTPESLQFLDQVGFS